MIIQKYFSKKLKVVINDESCDLEIPNFNDSQYYVTLEKDGSIVVYEDEPIKKGLEFDNISENYEIIAKYDGLVRDDMIKCIHVDTDNLVAIFN